MYSYSTYLQPIPYNPSYESVYPFQTSYINNPGIHPLPITSKQDQSPVDKITSNLRATYLHSESDNKGKITFWTLLKFEHYYL